MRSKQSQKFKKKGEKHPDAKKASTLTQNHLAILILQIREFVLMKVRAKDKQRKKKLQV
jgi:hypothetical protein